MECSVLFIQRSRWGRDCGADSRQQYRARDHLRPQNAHVKAGSRGRGSETATRRQPGHGDGDGKTGRDGRGRRTASPVARFVASIDHLQSAAAS